VRHLVLLLLTSCTTSVPCRIVTPAHEAWVAAPEVQVTAEVDAPGLTLSLEAGGAPVPLTPDEDGRATTALTLEPGDHLLTLRGARGGGEEVCAARALVRVGEVVPMTLEAPSAAAVYPPEVPVAGAAAPYAAVRVAVDGRLAGQLLADAEGRFVTTVTLPAGQHALEVVTAQRPEGFVQAMRTPVRVSDVAVPALRLLPSPATAATPLIAHLDRPLLAADGAPTPVTWAWSVDGAPQPDLRSHAVPAARLRRGQRWEVQVTPIAGPAARAAATITNAAPELREVHTSQARSDVPTWCRWTFADPDGDPDRSLVTWRIDGAPVATGATLPARPLRPGQEVRCEVTPHDGTEAGAPASAATSALPAPRGNILVVILDDVGVNDLPLYAPAGGFHTPTLDSLASQGLTFSRAWSTPFCAPTRAAILTGRHGMHTGFGGNIRADDIGGSLPDSELSWAEQLRATSARPWSIAAVGKWHIASWADGGGALVLSQGFDTYRGSIANLYDTQTVDGRATDYFTWEKYYDTMLVREEGYLTLDEFDDAIELATTLPEPWALWLAPHAAHEPFHDPPAEALPGGPTPVAETGEREEYAFMIESVDHQLARLLAAVPEDTHIFVLADNGVPSPVSGPGVLDTRAKGSVFEGGVRVPLVVRSPLVADPGSRTDALVHVVDLFPTLVELGGGSVAGLDLDGVSFLDVLSNQGWSGPREVVYTERFEPNGPGPYTRYDRAIRDDTHKLIRLNDGFDRLFRLDGLLQEGPDLMEQPLSAEDQAAYDRLVARLERGLLR
jgi:arylsulfatase A-like enzyme